MPYVIGPSHFECLIPTNPPMITPREDQLGPFVRVNLQHQISGGSSTLIFPNTLLEIASSLYLHPSTTRREACNTSLIVSSVSLDLAMSLTPCIGGRS